MSMKRLPWFRMYTDFLNDPKMISLAFEDQRHFIGILALKSDGALESVVEESLMDRIVAQRLWIDHGIIRDVKKRLVAAGLISTDWNPLAWDKRQMQSDKDETNAQRQKRYREAHKTPASDSNALHNGSVTRREEMREEEIYVATADQTPSVRAQSVIDLFHEVLPELPRVRLLNDKRKKSISSFCKWVLTSKRSDGQPRAQTADEVLVWVRSYFERARDNDFLMGRGAKSAGHANWECDIDFLLSDKGLKQVIEKTRELAA